MPFKDRIKPAAEPLYLIDGSSYLYRSFYAFPDLTRSDGFPTNALYILLRILLKVLREEKPVYLAFLLDGPGKTFRDEAYPTYKANRQATPENLIMQIAPLKEALKLLGLPLIVSEGTEADDCIASLAARFKRERPVVIMGSDKDLNQCLDANVWIWDPGAKAEKLTDLAAFSAETGLSPEAWPDFQALTGDSSDNIPGVPGVGPKTASRIMAELPTLEAIRDHLDRLPEKLQAKIAPHLDDLFLYRTLTRLKTDTCPDVRLADLSRAPVDMAAVRRFLEEYEFRTLARELPASLPAEPAARTRSVEKSGSLFDLLEAPAAPVYAGLADPADLPDVSGREVGLVRRDGSLALGLGEGEWRYAGPAAPLAARLATAARLSADSVKDLFTLDPAWRAIPMERWCDLSVAAYLLSPEDRDYSFDRLAGQYAGDPDVTPVPAGADGRLAAALGAGLSRKLGAAGMAGLLAELELPLIGVLVDMEKAGVRIDRTAFNHFLDEVSGRIEGVTRRIYALAGGEFNIRSSQQLAELLFTRLGLKPKGKTPGGLSSTSSDVLEKLAGEHEVIEAILEFRTLEKLRSTYLEPLPRLVDSRDRLHTTFNQLATATGRLSSSNPNLQNIPIRGPLGARLRACFTADEGMLLAAADYSQIELRLLAHMCGCGPLIEAFAHGEDIHARTAALLFDTPTDQVTPDMRRGAKTINFGLLYGMGPQRLARELKISLTEAKAFIARYFAALPGVKDFYESIITEAKLTGYVTTLFGRRRLLPDLNSRNQNQEAQARRQAVNTRVQGSAADIIKKAMILAHADPELQRLGARLILQIHDELLVEAPADTARTAGERLATIMSCVGISLKLSVPLSVDMGVGRTWAEAH
jgi:DNA polymerase-1